VRADAFTNTLKTTLLLGALGGLFVLLGSLLGGRTGAMIGLAIGLVTVGISFFMSDKLALRSANAKLVDEQQAPELYAMVRELAERADLPMPRVAVSPSMQPNAFATGRSPRHAVVAVTNGLLSSLPRDQVQGVLAHELMHVKHRDILIGSIAATLAGAIGVLAHLAHWGAIFGGYGGRDERNNGGGILGLLATAILAPIAATLIQLAISRSREFQADQSGAELVGSPFGLASALEKLGKASKQIPMEASPATAHLFIVAPFTGASFARLFSTHPPLEERIHRLLGQQGR
jgi:heat shock protein HtpX